MLIYIDKGDRDTLVDLLSTRFPLECIPPAT